MTPGDYAEIKAEHPNIILYAQEGTSLANMAYLIEHRPEEFLDLYW